MKVQHNIVNNTTKHTGSNNERERGGGDGGQDRKREVGGDRDK